MLKSGGAAIHMRQGFEGMGVLFAQAGSLEEMKGLPAKKVFDEGVCSFLDGWSGEILRDAQAREYPDAVTFGFFIRKANIAKLKQEYAQEGHIGRGLSFHIAPSNVPVNFAYTLAAGLLAGNPCIVRVSSKSFRQTDILCRLLHKAALSTGIGKYIAIVQYGRDKGINDRLSADADIRVIWGGDNTVNEIRKSPVPARCTEITFADRYSLCVLDAKSVIQIKDWAKVTQDFYNDTYLYDQNACSSPRLMYWIGTKEETAKAKELFWEAVYENISKRYAVEPVAAVDKLAMDCKIAIELENVKIEQGQGNLVHRIRVSQLVQELPDYACHSGSFIEYEGGSLDDLAGIVDRKYQTLSYFGCSAEGIAQWVQQRGLRGIDRVVPMGKTADFSLTWDGYDLIGAMSRKISYI